MNPPPGKALHRIYPRIITCLVFMMTLGCTDERDVAGCTADIDCDDGHHCRLGACIEDPGCRSQADCPAGHACRFARCELMRCVTDADCTEGLCDPALGYCTPRPPGFCQNDSDCPEGMCDPQTARCTIPIEDCDGGVCTPDGGQSAACSEEALCPSGQVCHPTGQCIDDCRLEGVSCAQEQRCAAETGLCRSGPCHDNGDCEEGARCHPSQTCIPDGCRRDGDCPREFVCGVSSPVRMPLTMGCLLNEGRRVGFSSCIEDEDCASLLCTPAGRCFQPCLADADCNGGRCSEVVLFEADAHQIIIGFSCEPITR